MSLLDGLVKWFQCLLRLGVEEGSKWAHLFIIGNNNNNKEKETKVLS